MKEVLEVWKENISHLGMIARIARYEDKASYQSHYLGMLWQFLNPAIQIGVYFVVFGMGLQRNGVDGIPYIAWMLVGIVPWFFMSSSILGASRSIYSKIGIVSKMKFPISILPTINIASNLVSYFAMMLIVLLTLWIHHIPMTLYWIQWVYYFICMLSLMFALGILNSTISVLVRDFHVALQSLVRLLFYMSGAILNVNNPNFPPLVRDIFALNPIYYIIEGFRNSFLHGKWFFEDPFMLVYFWSFIVVVSIIGCHLHMKFRNRFIDFV